jgi:hypothetical protein
MTIHARLPPIRLLPQRRQLSDSATPRNNFAFALSRVCRDALVAWNQLVPT